MHPALPDRQFDTIDPAAAGTVALAIVTGGSLARPSNADVVADSTAYVCPFCGATYAGSRRHCGSCGALPVVPREDRAVYETVVGPCGANCGTGGLAPSRS